MAGKPEFDSDPAPYTVRRHPFGVDDRAGRLRFWAGAPATTGLVAAAVLAWLVGAALLRLGVVDVAMAGGFIPARISGNVALFGAVPSILTPLTATFIHADWLHLALNMLMLVWAGKQVEPALGTRYFLLLYALGAYAAAAFQWMMGPHATATMIGASGAISAVVAVYALVFSEQKVRAIGPVPAYIVRVAWLAAAWVGIQALIGVGFGVGGTMVAVGAHIGGFLAGLVLARPLLRLRFAGR
ncbi:MAG: rhomboid family intramembrane serine protease [Sphingopyxis sp.]